jgi:hypothetical protein
VSEPDPQPSYRTRNIVLTVIAVVIVIAAVLRMATTATPQAPTTAAPSAPMATLPAPAPVAATAQLPVTAAGSGVIDVAVSYRGATDALPQAAKVYVFIRPVGQRMPLAVQTYAIADLPTTVEFSNPSESSADASVEAVARLSLTGAVALQPGDSEVVSDPVQFDTARHQLTLTLPGPATQ